MALNLLLSSPYTSQGNSVKCEATGGTSPYTYSLVSGGDGGSVNSSGIYTAPLALSKGVQVVRVRDSLGATKDATVYIYNYMQLICLIIRDFLGLASDQVYLYNQKFTIPKDDRLYIAVKLSNTKVFGNTSEYTGTQEEITTSCQGNVTIDALSKSLEALNRKEEIVAALKSQLSQNIQVANMFKIAEIPSSFSDLSQLEASAIPYRFNISVNVLYSTRIVKSVDYYDTFEPVQFLPESGD